MPVAILGISAYYHDSTAALVVDGETVAAAQEERFSRQKHDASFPLQSIRSVLDTAGIAFNDLTEIAYYEKPFLKFERLLETYHAFAPRGFAGFSAAMPGWISEKIFMRRQIRNECRQLGDRKVPLFFPEHHLSHAASAFFPSPFDESAILTIDGVGEWATTTIGHGDGHQIKILRELQFPHSIGLLYSAFTYYLGFTVNSGEYKVMGLAPYGNPSSVQTIAFKKKILDSMVDVREDGSVLLNMSYFEFGSGSKMTNNKKWAELLGIPKREPETDLNAGHMNLAFAIQDITADIVAALARTAKSITGSKHLVMAGGVALNCVANSRIRASGIFEDIWIQPAAGDAGGALGAALATHYLRHPDKSKRKIAVDSMRGSLLGPTYSDDEIAKCIRRNEAEHYYFADFKQLTNVVSHLIAQGNVIGWFQGRMEFGPRALGNRSILGDARDPEMQNRINLKVKFRESFRPFAPSVLLEDVSLYFDRHVASPYMLFVEPIKKELRRAEPDDYESFGLYERLYHVRSAVPAVTHVDYTSRLQTVNKEYHPRFWQLINSFKDITGCSMLINTSFNVRGEPIVCSPQDAFHGFMRTDIDFLVMGNYICFKTQEHKQHFHRLIRQLHGCPSAAMS